MAFNVEFQDKDGNIIDFNKIDSEVCELWKVDSDENDWATPPGKDYSDNWHEFLGYAVMLTRAYKETGTFLPSELLQGLCSFGCMYPKLESIDKYKYELQLIFYWIKKGYKIVVTNRW